MLTAAALIGTAAGTAAAAPQPIGRCTTSTGVVLAVDFSRWGGPILRSCGTTPTTGHALLNQGGWRTTGTGHDGPAFICRIGYSGFRDGKQYPPPREEDCVLTPPASAYWSYWHADPGKDTWEYSKLGAMSYRPRPGSVDLWIFGGTDIGGDKGRPTVTPDQLRAHNTRPTGGGTGERPRPKPGGPSTRPTPERTPPPRTAQPPADGQRTQEPPTGKRPTPTPTPSRTATKPPSSPSPSSAPPRPSASTAPSGPGAVAAPSARTEVVDAAPAAGPDRDSGSSLPAVATGALLLLIGAGAAVAVRRRRRAE
ncbi:hypothetical protein I3J09_01915 [Streptomyces clavuligerus]|nr:hypothetical protein BB341_01940 [Streptomyces clavuligerus]AXU16390.1 hypothetical protein D1794_02045 [Streptomyces clavuligerus]MBY6301437.1 hypothetical protein [Streptomyces clavuligerus]QPL66379.1 hypothetical protein I3J04_01915 [Streptomyces clavuligerus]QPL72411.1 hypothetical protein I3J05_01930 [Streptomyces clavuligerus]